MACFRSSRCNSGQPGRTCGQQACPSAGTVESDDLVEALDLAWPAFRMAAGDDLAGWDLGPGASGRLSFVAYRGRGRHQAGSRGEIGIGSDVGIRRAEDHPCLLRWYREGADPQQQLFRLSTFMGHGQIVTVRRDFFVRARRERHAPVAATGVAWGSIGRGGLR